MTHLIIPSFIAGLLTFLAPCTLPLIPAYLGFVGGSSIRDALDEETASHARRRVFLNGLFFVLGFSAVFILLGVFAGTLGSLVAVSRIWLARIGGAMIVMFGLIMLDVFPIPQLASAHPLFRMQMETVRRGKYGFSFLLGVMFGTGWTPCIGPILGAVLTLAGTSATAFSGAILLAVFSIGLAVPFLAIALSLGRAHVFIARNIDKLKYIQKISGVFMVGLGLLFLFNKVHLLTEYGYKLFNFIPYESLINYL